jgi:hypothetical protein
MIRFRSLFIATALMAVGATALSGCGDSTSTNLPEGYGTLKVDITDGPIDLTEISNLYITFDELYVVPDPDSLLPDSLNAPIHILTSPVTLDLLALANGLTATLGTAQLPEGNYRAIHILVSEGDSWLIEADGDTEDVKIPSNRLKVITDFTVTSGGVSEIVLDFDAAASLHKTGNGYILRPVVRQLPDRPLGATIEGTVLVDTGSGLVSAGEYMVPNPRFGRPGNGNGHGHGKDNGHGRRPGDRGGRGRRPDLREEVPLTVAWPMIVHASVEGDSAGDDSSEAVRGQLVALDNDEDDFPPGDPRFHRAHPRATVVGIDGHYKLWRLRKDATYELRLHIHPRSGFEIVSGPGPILLTGDTAGQDFVIRAIPAAP